jgi:hypothetical protein
MPAQFILTHFQSYNVFLEIELLSDSAVAYFVNSLQNYSLFYFCVTTES